MKKSKIIIPALAMLVMSSAAAVTGTVAWFTMNTTASAEGMSVAAKTNGSLVVKEIAAQNAELPGVGDRATKVIFGSTNHAFYPSTHDLSIGTATGLRRVSNGMAVNFETGTAMNSTTTLNYTAVANGENDYYFDYGLFVCGDGLAMPNQKLTISISTPTALALNMYNALSVDFYGAVVSTPTYPDVSSTNYIGTLNLAGRANVYQNDANSIARPTGAITTGVTSIQNDTAFEIPKSGSGSAYSIRMRVYFDGELIDVAKSGNFYANYTACGEGSVSGSEGYLFYSDEDGTSIVDAKVGDETDNLYKVNGGVDGTSTLTYARSIDIGTFSAQKIDVAISSTTVNS